MKNQGRRWLKERLNALQSLSGYAIGETVESLAQRLKTSPSEILKLNSNENFFIPKERLNALLIDVIEEYDPRIYPQEEEKEFKRALSKYLEVPPECIVVGNGGDQLIDLIARLFLLKDEVALSITPTFSMYGQSVSLQGARYVGVPLKDDFSLDVEGILAAATPETRLLFLCSPNNPTANQFGVEEVQALIEKFKGVVVVDEAYVEFADHSITRLAEEFENLIVLRTLSKAFGLAGLRSGYAVANPHVVSSLSKAQLPYSVSTIALKAGLKLLENIEVVNRAVEQLKRERARLVEELNSLKGVSAFDSQANFVLFQTRRQSSEVFQALMKRGILVKNLGRILHINNCLRTTVGLREMNDKLLGALEQACGEGD